MKLGILILIIASILVFNSGASAVESPTHSGNHIDCQQLTDELTSLIAFLYSADGWTWPPERPPYGRVTDILCK